MAYARIRPRRGTSYEWSTYNPILESGELGLEYPDTGLGTGLCKWKVGNGSDHWNDLEYAFDGTAASSFDGGTVSSYRILKLRSSSSENWADLDPILNKNELVYVTDKNMFKVGNGVDTWSNLPYCGGSGGGGGMDDSFYDCGSEDALDEIYSAPNRSYAEYPDIEFPAAIDSTENEEDQEDSIGLDSLLDEETVEGPSDEIIDNEEVIEPEESNESVIEESDNVEEPKEGASEEVIVEENNTEDKTTTEESK